MNLGEQYDYVNFVLNRDQLGSPTSPDQFNMLINRFSMLLYNEEYQILIKAAKEGDRNFIELYYESGPLRRFENTIADAGITEFTDMPENFKRLLSAKLDLNNAIRPVLILGPKAFDSVLTNIMSESLDESPIGRIYPTKIRVLPTGGDLTTAYLRKAVDPVFDYCMDDGDNVVYMPVGSEIVDVAGTWTLKDSGGTTIIAPVTHSKVFIVGDLPYTSTSVELDWDDEFKEKIIEDVIGAASMRAKELQMVQLSDAEKSKQG